MPGSVAMRLCKAKDTVERGLGKPRSLHSPQENIRVIN